MTEKELPFSSLGITVGAVCQQMGFPVSESDGGVAALFRDGTDVAVGSAAAAIAETRLVVSAAGRMARPRFCYLVVPALPPAFHVGNVIARQLSGSDAYALFIATAGVEYAAFMARQERDGGLLRTFIADALGTLIAERCADAMEAHLQQSIGKLGWRHTNRFSPGYCGWPVAEQQLLFPLFGGATCGVRLTESSLMVPEKSVSGVVGLGAGVSRQDYLCSKGKDGIAHCELCRLRDLV